MDERESNGKKIKSRKPPWFLGGFVLLLLIFLFLLQSSNVWKNLSVNSAGDTLLLYGLSSLNFIAFIIFAFILIRSLLKLRQERRTLQLGSKIKTRLLMYFAAVSILPLVAMAVFSYWFMNRAVQNWFTQIPENVIRKTNDVRSETYQKQLAKLKKTAPMLAEVLDKQDIASWDLQQIIAAGDLTRLEIINSDNEILAKAEKNLSAEQENLLNKKITAFYQRENNRGENNGLVKLGESNFSITTAEMSGGKKLILVRDLPDESEINRLTQEALTELDKLKSQQNVVRQFGITTLGLLTFLLVFASSWIAFYIGKNITRPIRALAEGADEIAKGNFAHRVDIFAEDELDLLVKSFNEMSGRLEENSAELEERQKYIETILQSLSTGVISFDDQNRITTINKAAVKMFKLEDADFADFELNQLVNRENSRILEKLISRAKRIGVATEQTALQRENEDGNAESSESLPVALTATTLPDKNGAVLVIEDLTELITAQRASAWQEVARRMAHEIKNPLTPIQLSAERIAKRFKSSNGENELRTTNYELREDDKNSKIIKDGTETILREVASLKYMVDEFSRYARLPEPLLKKENLNEIIKQTVLLYQDRIDDVRIEMNLAENLPKTLIDEEQLKRVFVNLIDNSFEAFEKTDIEKVISIKTFNDPARDLIVAEVADNGRGIEPSSFQKLFQPYFSTKGRGTGLGLAIVQRIVSEHGGKIKVVSNTPKGAKFIIELPLATS